MSRLSISLEDLETFIAIADAGSFSLAAARLNVSQPTVTARIKKLEDNFGATLFTRTTRKVVTTSAGERLRTSSELLLLQLHRLRDDLRGEASLARGTLNVGASPALAAMMLPPLIAQFARFHPGISIRIHDEHRRQTLSDLSTGVVDMAILGECRKSREFDFEPLFSIEFYVIGPADHPLAGHDLIRYEDLSRYPLLTMPLHESIWNVVAAEFKQRGIALHSSFEATSMFTVLKMVEAGLGLTILPSIALSVLDGNKHMAVKLAGSQRLSREIGIALMRGRELSPSARAFRQFARKWVRNRIGMPDGLYRALSTRSRGAAQEARLQSASAA